jgi:hypothetical protein
MVIRLKVDSEDSSSEDTDLKEDVAIARLNRLYTGEYGNKFIYMDRRDERRNKLIRFVVISLLSAIPVLPAALEFILKLFKA